MCDKKLKEFYKLLLKWNKKINLISKSNEHMIFERHINDSKQLLNFIKKDSILTDFGSGGGFPGIILSICGVETVHLIESDTRKAAFLYEASKISDNNIIIHNRRIEELNSWNSNYITARALANLNKLLSLTKCFFQKNTTALFFKGKNLEIELAEAKKYWQIKDNIHKNIIDNSGYILELTHLGPLNGKKL